MAREASGGEGGGRWRGRGAVAREGSGGEGEERRRMLYGTGCRGHTHVPSYAVVGHTGVVVKRCAKALAIGWLSARTGRSP